MPERPAMPGAAAPAFETRRSTTTDHANRPALHVSSRARRHGTLRHAVRAGRAATGWAAAIAGAVIQVAALRGAF